MSAPRQYNFWTRYNFSGALKGFYVAGGANYTGDQTILPDTPTWAHQTYTLWSGLVGYSTKILGRQTKFEFNGKNLTNEYYRPSQSSRCRPREFTLSVSTKL
jgi:iron complex outermembrane receptor protein